MRLRIDYDHKTGDSVESRFFGTVGGVEVWIPITSDWTLTEDELAKMSQALHDLEVVASTHNLKLESIMVVTR